MDCSLPFLKLTRRIRVPFLSRFLLLVFVYNCSLFLLRFVLFVFSLSLLPHVSTLSFCFETKLSPLCFGQNQHGADLKSLSFGDVLGCLETLFEASTLQLREDWATPRAGGSAHGRGVKGLMGINCWVIKFRPSFHRNGKSGKWTFRCSENNNNIKLILTPCTNFGKFF